MTTYQRTCQTCGNGVSHQRQTVTEDAYCTGYRDGRGDAWAELPYRPPPPAQRGTDLRWEPCTRADTPRPPAWTWRTCSRSSAARWS